MKNFKNQEGYFITPTKVEYFLKTKLNTYINFIDDVKI